VTAPASIAPDVQDGLSLSLLRGFELRRDGRPLRVPLSAQRVVAFLALHAHPLARVFVAGNLWSDVSDARAGAALRTALWRLGERAQHLVRAEGHTLALGAEVDVDLTTACQCAQALLRPAEDGVGSDDLELLRDAGDLLPDWYEDWVLIERERFRQLRLHALEALCRRLSRAGRHAEATEAGMAAIACEPLRESAHRAVVEVHLAEGNTAEALRQYELCRELLECQLGLAPTAAFQLLVDPLRRR
jgi:DNA-binding SARP family transcriptional activator